MSTEQAPTIRLKQALQAMENEPGFSITYVNYNNTTKKGGKLISLRNCNRAGFNAADKKNRTINVLHPGAEKPVKIHQFLITAYNQKVVIP